MTIFAAIALVLAVVGVYAVMAYLVAQRTHEIGVRIALGATAAAVIRLAVAEAGRLTAIGVGVGLIAATLSSRLIEAGLLATVSNDIRMSGAFAAVLLAAAMLASYLPARRAASVDPIIALRAE